MPLPASVTAKKREFSSTLTIEFSSGLASLRESFLPLPSPFFTRDLLAMDVS